MKRALPWQHAPSWAQRHLTRGLAHLAHLLVLALLIPSLALAEPSPPLTNRDYALDLHQGAVLGSTRVIGLGGAYVAIADGSEGIRQNPAAAVNRTYFGNAHFNWTWHVDFVFGSTFGSLNLDLDNNGHASKADAFLLTAGLAFQYGNFGVGISLNWHQFDLGTIGNAGVSYLASLLDAHLAAGYAFFDHQLIVSGAFRAGSLSLALSDHGGEDSLFDISVIGVEAGVLFRPRRWPLRFGATFSVAFDRTQDTTCDTNCPTGFFLPNRVTLPWELRLGVAYRLGVGRFNPLPAFIQKAQKQAENRTRARREVKRERAKTERADHTHAGAQPLEGPARTPVTPAQTKHPMTAKATQPTSHPISHPGASTTTRPAPSPPRTSPLRVDLDRDYRGGRYFLISSELVIIGPSKNATGPNGFADQVHENVGENVVVSIHIGAETEVWRRRLRLRLGSYWEPSRYQDRWGRIHGTASILLRLFDFSLWGHHALSWAPCVDVASNYLNISFLVSFWH
ncbi:MAG: hypothetical protein KAI47_19575 [Deltaproteobacteria bacterium]|nr:hypothetical protein [Deltaproteobacteria bacterium]